MTEEQKDLADAVALRQEEVMSGESAFIGECREAVPFGETFYVTSHGTEYLSCTHLPPHTHTQ